MPEEDSTNMGHAPLLANFKMKTPVSVLIPVKNEEREISDCIRSVQWADEIVVVDSGSTDRTQALAEAAGARVQQFTFALGGPKKKNWALDSVDFRHEWILILDADERITPELAAEIQACLASPQTHSGYFINRRFYFMNRWIKHAGYFTSWNMRLFKRNAARYEKLNTMDTSSGDNEVHEHVILQGSSGRLQAPMDHFAFRSIEQFVVKHNRYSNWEAAVGVEATRKLAGDSSIDQQLNRRRKLKRLARKFPFPHWARFFYHYVLRKGFLDGLEGYIFCHLLGEYEFLIWAKGMEAAHNDPRGAKLTVEARSGSQPPGDRQAETASMSGS